MNEWNPFPPISPKYEQWNVTERCNGREGEALKSHGLKRLITWPNRDFVYWPIPGIKNSTQPYLRSSRISWKFFSVPEKRSFEITHLRIPVRTVRLNLLIFFLLCRGKKKKSPILVCFSLAFVEKVSVWHFGAIVFISLEYGWRPTSVFYVEGPGRGPNVPVTMRLTSSHKTEASATKTNAFPFHAIYILWSCLNYADGKLTRN